MSAARVWLMVLVSLAALGRPALAGQQAASEQERRVPGCLCVPAVSQSDFEQRFDADTRRRWNNSYVEYKRWLKHVEILEFFGGSDENQTFLMSARNVTPDDDVYLRVRRANPVLYGYATTVVQTDTPEQPLLTIAGAPVAMINPIAVQKAAGNVDAKAAETNTVSGAPPVQPASGKTSDPDEMLRALTGRATAKGEDKWTAAEKKMAAAQPHFEASYAHLEAARRDLGAYLGRIGGLRSEVARLTTDVRILADDVVGLERFDCLNNERPCDGAYIKKVLGERGGQTTLSEILKRHDQLALQLAILSVPPVEIDQDLEQSERALQRARELLQSANVPADKINALPDFSIINGGIKSVRTKTTEGAAPLKDLGTAMEELRTKLQELHRSLTVAMRRASDADVCLLLGRFAAQKSIRVSVDLAQRPLPAPPKEPDNARIAKLAHDLLAEVEKAKGGSSSKKAPADEDEEKEKPGDKAADKPDPKTVRSASSEFYVLRPIHVQTTLGWGVSWLANPSFDFKSRVIPEVKGPDGTVITPAMKEITPFALDHNEIQSLPMVQFGLHVVERYPFAEPDASPNESIRPWHRWIPFPTLGFSLTEPTKNLFVGGGVNLSRGVIALAGGHLGNVTQLVDGKQEDVSFTIPGTADFAIDDVLDKGPRWSFFFALAIDSSTVGKLFSAAGTGDGGDAAKKKEKN